MREDSERVPEGGVFEKCDGGGVCVGGRVKSSTADGLFPEFQVGLFETPGQGKGTTPYLLDI